MSMDIYKIANIVKDRKSELDLSYQELAERTGMTKSTLQRYVSGGIRNIPMSRLRSLATALELSEQQLLGLEPIQTGSPAIIQSPKSKQMWAEPLIAAYSAAARPKQEAVCTVLDIPYIAPNKVVESHPFRAPEERRNTMDWPRSDLAASAGFGEYLDEESFHIIRVDADKLPKS